jgi:hypothetical protein
LASTMPGLSLSLFTRVWTQGLDLAKQALCNLSHSASTFFFFKHVQSPLFQLINILVWPQRFVRYITDIYRGKPKPTQFSLRTSSCVFLRSIRSKTWQGYLGKFHCLLENGEKSQVISLCHWNYF